MFRNYRTMATGLIAIPVVQLLGMVGMVTPEVGQFITNLLLGLAAAFLHMAIENK